MKKALSCTAIHFTFSRNHGGVPERLNGAVSKTVVASYATVGSNPTPSASCCPDRLS